MSTILVTGDSGMLGARLVPALAEHGHEVRAASRHPRCAELPSRVQAVSVDVVTGAGLLAALDGVEIVVHAASAPSGDTQAVDVQGTRRLVVAAAEAGIAHLLYVAIVGVDEIPYAYYRAKFAAEQIVATGRVPWTVQRLTQFHPFLASLLDKVSLGPVTLVPARVPLQPIDPDDAARVLTEDAEAGPVGRAPDRGGPIVAQAQGLASQYRAARHPNGRVVPVPMPGELGRRLRSGAATCPDGASSTGASFTDWLARPPQPPQQGSAP
jgi:uncharacterized protein YbjT (DUF2867 family)